jgi:hypothetical protein
MKLVPHIADTKSPLGGTPVYWGLLATVRKSKIPGIPGLDCPFIVENGGVTEKKFSRTGDKFRENRGHETQK